MTSTSGHTLSSRVLHLEIAKAQRHLKISLTSQRAGEMQTVRHVEEVAVSIEHIGRRCRQIVETLNRANRNGKLHADLLQKLKELGQHFRDELFSIGIKERLNTSDADQLIITLDDQLVHIPWELLHDGQAFLCQRFAMGRVVRTRQAVADPDSRIVTPPLKMLILADPRGDLKAAYQEGVGLRDFMDSYQASMRVEFRSQGVNADLLKSKIRNYDLIHFAGHATYDDQHPENSGWRLSKDQLTAAHIARMAGTGSMPALIFSNACQSARTDAWDAPANIHDRIFGLANAFILSGVKHYVGTFWEIADETSQRFAAAFYHYLLNGMPIGKAVQAGRNSLIEHYGEDNIIWASYLLYGDPTSNYLGDIEAIEPQAPPVDMQEKPTMAAVSETRAPEDVIHFAARAPAKSRKHLMVGVGALILIIIAVLYGLRGPKGVQRSEEMALAAFKDGDYPRVEQTCQRLQDQAPQRGLSYVLLGNVHFFKGDLEQARYLYRHAMQAERISEMDKAEALIGLGRIASENGQSDQALHYYQRAGEVSPASERPYLAQALLLEKRGEFDQAAMMLRKAQSATAEQMPLDGLAARLEAKANREADQQRQARIDQLMADLNRQMAATDEPRPKPGWSSRPLTIWLMDLEPTGYSLQEGSAVLLSSAMSDRLLQQHAFQVVERAMLDKMMDELRLGTSKLADARAMLYLGRLVSARLIVYGRMVHSAPHAQVALRCIDTETGEIVAIVNSEFDTQTGLAAMAARIADELTLKLKKHFPLQATIVEKHDDRLILDVGSRQGASIGVTLKGIGIDLTAEIVAVTDHRCTAVVQGDGREAAAGTRLRASTATSSK